jgi:beta-glucosidase
VCLGRFLPRPVHYWRSLLLDRPRYAGCRYFDHSKVLDYPGQEAGGAFASVLFGDASASGKMPYTTGHSLDEYLPHTIVSGPMLVPQAYFNESTLADYRWFSAKNITLCFEFGFSLSYSTFEYSNLTVTYVSVLDNTSI